MFAVLLFVAPLPPQLEAFRAFNMLVETASFKRPSESTLGTDVGLLSPSGAGNGHVPRNLRLALQVCVNRLCVCMYACLNGWHDVRVLVWVAEVLCSGWGMGGVGVESNTVTTLVSRQCRVVWSTVACCLSCGFPDDRRRAALCPFQRRDRLRKRSQQVRLCVYV